MDGKNEALRNIKSGQVAREDQIEMIKWMEKMGKKQLHQICKNTEKISKDQKNNILLPIYKKREKQKRRITEKYASQLVLKYLHELMKRE